MKDKIMHNGRISCFCSKCHSKNVYYLKQRKVVLPFSQNNEMIHNQDNGEWYTLRTTRERYCMYDIAWNNAETELLMLVCRDCGESEQIEL